jgi:pyrroline-5-carboxylate reductase
MYCFFGGGAMAEAMIGGLKTSGTDLSRVRVIEISAQRRRLVILQILSLFLSFFFLSRYLRNTFGNEIVLYAEGNEGVFSGVDILCLCIKPQYAEAALEGLVLPESLTVVSIMGGVTIPNIKSMLKHEKVVRCMPNTPAQVFKGVTGYTFEKNSISEEDREMVVKLLNSLGDCVIFVQDESYLDKITGLSGSGPGLFICFDFVCIFFFFLTFFS